jgi:histidinol dehydrogenase
MSGAAPAVSVCDPTGGMLMSTKAKQEKLVEILRAWQHIENRSVAQATQIIERTGNPAIRMVMEIIQRDSAMHHRVQQFIIDSFEEQAIALTADDLAQVWEAIEAHIESERKTGVLVVEAQDALLGTRNPVQQLLLSYLGNDERKHDQLLEDLSLVKRGMYKSA